LEARVKTTGVNPIDPPRAGRLAWASAIAVLGVSLFVASQAVALTSVRDDGFAQPFAGAPKYEKYAPTEALGARQINRPLGIRDADRIARGLGLNRRHVFTARQYRLLVSGQGVGGDRHAAKLIRESIRILINTTGTPEYVRVKGKLTPVVLGSYGLTVNRNGWLETPANTDAPTRQINELIKPGGYFATWCRHNGAEASLRMLNRSAYPSEVIYGFKAQQQSGAAQLAPNQKRARGSIIGMSMAPPLWIVNFVLMYTLNPQEAAKMPAYWAPIPAKVALAIAESPTGQVRYARYQSSFPG
jgi:hypothetical protein